MMFQRITAAAVAVGCLTVGAHAATITPVNPPEPGQNSHEQILEDTYGGDFVQSGNDFSNGSIQATRVDDDNDQYFNLAYWSARAVARWADADQAFGTTDEQTVFDAVGSGASVTGSVSDVQGGEFVFFSRFGNRSQTADVSTFPDVNPDLLDHAVTYVVQPLPPANQPVVHPDPIVLGQPIAPGTVFLLFFEDSPEGARFADFDYNDLVVEVTSVVPEPSSLALIVLGVIIATRRR